VAWVHAAGCGDAALIEEEASSRQILTSESKDQIPGAIDYSDVVLKDSEGIRTILKRQERELKDAQDRGDESAAILIAGRKAWIEEFVVSAELLAVAELKEKRTSAENDLAEAEVVGNADTAQSAKVRIEAIQEALRALQEGD
jgi:hypothetical protein